jgi:hypothetical protein
VDATPARVAGATAARTAPADTKSCVAQGACQFRWNYTAFASCPDECNLPAHTMPRVIDCKPLDPTCAGAALNQVEFANSTSKCLNPLRNPGNTNKPVTEQYCGPTDVCRHTWAAHDLFCPDQKCHETAATPSQTVKCRSMDTSQDHSIGTIQTTDVPCEQEACEAQQFVDSRLTAANDTASNRNYSNEFYSICEYSTSTRKCSALHVNECAAAVMNVSGTGYAASLDNIDPAVYSQRQDQCVNTVTRPSNISGAAVGMCEYVPRLTEPLVQRCYPPNNVPLPCTTYQPNGACRQDLKVATTSGAQGSILKNQIEYACLQIDIDFYNNSAEERASVQRPNCEDQLLYPPGHALYKINSSLAGCVYVRTEAHITRHESCKLQKEDAKVEKCTRYLGEDTTDVPYHHSGGYKNLDAKALTGQERCEAAGYCSYVDNFKNNMSNIHLPQSKEECRAAAVSMRYYQAGVPNNPQFPFSKAYNASASNRCWHDGVGKDCSTTSCHVFWSENVSPATCTAPDGGACNAVYVHRYFFDLDPKVASHGFTDTVYQVGDSRVGSSATNYSALGWLAQTNYSTSGRADVLNEQCVPLATQKCLTADMSNAVTAAANCDAAGYCTAQDTVAGNPYGCVTVGQYLGGCDFIPGNATTANLATARCLARDRSACRTFTKPPAKLTCPKVRYMQLDLNNPGFPNVVGERDWSTTTSNDYPSTPYGRLPCSYAWKVSSWSACPTVCGSGQSIPTRTVECRRLDDDGVWIDTDPTITDAACEKMVGPKPADKKTWGTVCPKTQLCHHTWVVMGSWPSCNQTCGTAAHKITREVKCIKAIHLNATKGTSDHHVHNGNVTNWYASTDVTITLNDSCTNATGTNHTTCNLRIAVGAVGPTAWTPSISSQQTNCEAYTGCTYAPPIIALDLGVNGTGHGQDLTLANHYHNLAGPAVDESLCDLQRDDVKRVWKWVASDPGSPTGTWEHTWAKFSNSVQDEHLEDQRRPQSSMWCPAMEPCRYEWVAGVWSDSGACPTACGQREKTLTRTVHCAAPTASSPSDATLPQKKYPCSTNSTHGPDWNCPDTTVPVPDSLCERFHDVAHAADFYDEEHGNSNTITTTTHHNSQLTATTTHYTTYHNHYNNRNQHTTATQDVSVGNNANYSDTYWAAGLTSENMPNDYAPNAGDKPKTRFVCPATEACNVKRCSTEQPGTWSSATGCSAANHAKRSSFDDIPCPVIKKCEGYWTSCNAACEKSYVVTDQGSGHSGFGCPNTQGDTQTCQPGDSSSDSCISDCTITADRLPSFSSLGAATDGDTICKASLTHGTTCTVKCNPNYVAKGLVMCMDGVLFKGTAECTPLETVELISSQTEANFPGLVSSAQAAAGYEDSLGAGADVKNVRVEQKLNVEFTFASAPDVSTPAAKQTLVNQIAQGAGIDISKAGVDVAWDSSTCIIDIDWEVIFGASVGRRRRLQGFSLPVTIKNPPGKSLNASLVTNSAALAASMAAQGASVTITKQPTATSKIVADVTGTADVQNAISSSSLGAAINNQLPADQKLDASTLSQVTASKTASTTAPGAGGGLGSGSGTTLQQTVIEDKDEDDLIAVIVAESIVVGVLLIVLVLLCMRNTANGKQPSSGASA